MVEFVEHQSIYNNILNKIINKNLNVHAYMLVCDEKEILNKTSILMAKSLICYNKFDINCKECNICKRIDNNDYSELQIINPINNNIKKERILELRTRFQEKPIESKNNVYIINDCEFLGSSAANSILKFLEEPESNVVGIFTTRNLNSVYDTIKSRCQIIKLNNNISEKEYIRRTLNLSDDEQKQILEFFYLLEKNDKIELFNKIDLLVNIYKEKEQLMKLFNSLLFMYMDKLNYFVFGKFKYFDFIDYEKLKKEENSKNILNQINIIMEISSKISYNLNLNLLFSSLILKMGEV